MKFDLHIVIRGETYRWIFHAPIAFIVNGQGDAEIAMIRIGDGTKRIFLRKSCFPKIAEAKVIGGN